MNFIDGKTVETETDFILGGSKITADGECSHEIKRHLLLGRKVMTNIDNRETLLYQLQMVTAAMKLKDAYSLEGKL